MDLTAVNKANPRILISNDDGINAPGIKVLEDVARSLSDDFWVVAPEVNNSGAGHSLTLHHPLRLRDIDDRHFAVDGTPTDCVMMAIHHLLKDNPPDFVLSGVNHGGNMAEDMTYSGTIAAAMEAILLDIPAIAFSQACNDYSQPNWDVAACWAPKVLRAMREFPWPGGILLNVNFPDCDPTAVKGIKSTVQGRRAIGEDLVERIDPRGRPYVWIGALRGDDHLDDGTDVAAVADGYVSITPIHLDMTHHHSLATLDTLLQS